MTTPPPTPPSSSPPPSVPQPLILGLSGVSSSGKTTIATHLSSIFSFSGTPLCDVTLIHADDFYLPEASLPFRAGHRDWDCAAALDLPALCACLEAWLHRGEPVRARPRQGVLTPLLEGEDRDGGNAEENLDVRLLALTSRLRDETQRQATADGISVLPRLLILDGFLLFPAPPVIPLLPSLLHIKILLRTTRSAALARRLARPGYATLEGFWADPPGYFEDVVWPHYVEAHARYFEGGDVEGGVDEEACQSEGVVVGSEEEGLEGVLEWVVGVVRKEMGIAREHEEKEDVELVSEA
ncbi:ribosylnicotinamide kinase [Pseudocyphellaria aurata]|nr:ribosylnicotinamide kinase [Pseudocyphellaria aurata]